MASSAESVLVYAQTFAYLTSMDGYNQFCPLAQAAEVLARRWTILVVRELLCGSHRFNDLHRGVPKMSRSLLSTRLDELEAAGVVERRTVGANEHPEYHLTEAGEALRPIVIDLGAWGKRWVQRAVSREELDAGLLMWDIHRRIVHERLPPRRVVVHFRFSDGPADYRDFWLVLEREAIDLCLQDPGYEVNLTVHSDVRTLTEVWLGDLTLRRTLADQSIRLTGPVALQRQFPDWLGLSVYAGIAREPNPREAQARDALANVRRERPFKARVEGG